MTFDEALQEAVREVEGTDGFDFRRGAYFALDSSVVRALHQIVSDYRKTLHDFTPTACALDATLEAYDAAKAGGAG